VPTYTIALSDALNLRLARHVDANNQGQGTQLSVGDWLQRHILEIATQQDTMDEHVRLVRQAEADVGAALTECRERLISGPRQLPGQAAPSRAARRRAAG